MRYIIIMFIMLIRFPFKLQMKIISLEKASKFKAIGSNYKKNEILFKTDHSGITHTWVEWPGQWSYVGSSHRISHLAPRRSFVRRGSWVRAVSTPCSSRKQSVRYELGGDVLASPSLWQCRSRLYSRAVKEFDIASSDWARLLWRNGRLIIKDLIAFVSLIKITNEDFWRLYSFA